MPNRILMSLATLMVLGATGRAGAADERAVRCEQRWREESGKIGLRGDAAELLARWKSVEEECRGTEVYEARLAVAYLLSGDLAGARRVLDQWERLAPGRPASVIIQDAQLQVKLFELGRSGELAGPGLEKALILLKEFCRNHPDAIEARGQLGAVQSASGLHMEAIENLSAATKSELNTVDLYIRLTISLEAVARHSDALLAMEEAYRRDPEVAANGPLMLAVARAQIALGRHRAASDTLNVLLMKSPGIQQEREFRRVVEALRSAEAPAGGLEPIRL